MRLPDKIYDVLKWTCLLALPAIAWFIAQVGPVWGWPDVDAWVKTLNAAGTAIGVLIGVSALSTAKTETDDEKKDGE